MSFEASARPQIRFEHLNTSDGLSQNGATSILRDRQGFVWIGTRDGLNRFDGYQFKRFRHNSNDSASISDNYISAIYQDRQGVLWIGTGNGLNRYDDKTESFTRYIHAPGQQRGLFKGAVRAIIEDHEGILWVGTDGGGLNALGSERKQFVHFVNDPAKPHSLGNNHVTSLLQDSRGLLWVGTEDGLNRFDIGTRQFKRFKHDREQNTHTLFEPLNEHSYQDGSLSDDWVKVLFEDKQGSLWVGTEGGGLNKIDLQKQSVSRMGRRHGRPPILGSGFISDISEGPEGRLWIATWGGGISIFDPLSGQTEVLRANKDNRYSIVSDQIFKIYRDAQGLMWVCTSTGVDLYNPETARFGHVYHDPDIDNSLKGFRVRAILKDSQGNVWAGTRGSGLNRIDGQTGAFRHFVHDPSDPDSLSAGQIYSLFEDSKGDIWVGTSTGLNRFDAFEQKFVHYFHHGDNPYTLSSNRVTSISESANGDLWFGTWGGGINRFDRVTGQFQRFWHSPNNADSLSHDMVMTIFHDDQNRLWIGTVGGGVNRFDANKGRFVHYRHDPKVASSISNDRVFSIVQTDPQSMWFGTAGGLNRLNLSSGEFSHYNESDGLANDTVLSILEDGQGMLWLSTNKGLSKLDPNVGQFINYSAIDGLQHDEFSINSAHRGADGELLFGGTFGFNRFYPEAIKPRTSKSNIVLTDFKLANKSVAVSKADEGTSDSQFYLPMALNALDELTLSHRETLVTIEFAALDFINPDKLEYAYKLEGWDDDWIYSDSKRRFATYTKLDPGHYQFKVKVTNADGFWREDHRALAVKVLPPWWVSKPALVTYVLLLLICAWALYFYRTQALVKRAAELEQSVFERTKTINRLMAQKDRMFANVSHEFKTPLTLILNPLESLVQSIDKDSFSSKVAMMRRNGQRLLRMVDQLLELSKLDTTQSEIKHRYSLSQTMDLLLASFEPLFQSKQLTVHYEPCEEIVLTTTSDALEMILNNLLSNAVKYTPNGGVIEVSIIQTLANVQIQIKDDGIGIGKEDQPLVFNRFTRAASEHGEKIPGAGIGLALVKELVEANGGSIELESALERGSCFTVNLPVSEQTEGEIENTIVLSDSSRMVIESMHQHQPVRNQAEYLSGELPAVLAIDDNSDMLELLNETLASRYQFICANSGERGLSTARQALPDIIISDVMMPGMSGFDVLRELKNDPLTNHIPVILLTAKGDCQSRIRGWTENADEYLEKPFNSVELHARIDNLLFVRSLMRQKYQSRFTSDEHYDGGSELVLGLPENEADLNVVNIAFCRKVEAVLELHYSDENFDVNILASEMAMSYRQLGRKMKALLNLTPSESIRCFRLKKAAEKLKQGFSPGGVAHEVGFTSHSYFSQCFKAMYNCLPSSYK